MHRRDVVFGLRNPTRIWVGFRTSTHRHRASSAVCLTHTRYPKLGPWYPPTFGLAAAMWTAAYALPLWGAMLVWMPLLIGGVALTRSYLARRGTLPDPKRAPAPIKREMTYFLTAYALAIGVIIITFLAVAWWAGAAIAFVTMTAGIAIYERRYATAAHQAEVAAGIAA